MPQRHLEFFETLLYYAHQNGHSQMTVQLKLTGNLSQSQISGALTTLFNKHPLLRSRITQENAALCFNSDLSFADIPVNFLESGSEAAQQATYLQIANKEMDLSQHNWSVDIFNQDSRWNLIFHISHVVADGLSIINLMQELITSLEDPDVSLPAYPLQPGCEKHLTGSLTPEQWFAATPSFPCIEITDTIADHKTNLSPYISFTLDHRQLAPLRAQAKEHQVSINSVLNAAYILAYWEINQDFFDLALGSALNLRNKCTPKISIGTCGNYFAPIHTPILQTATEKKLWTLAQYYQTQLGKVIAQQNYLPTDYNYTTMNHNLQHMISQTTNNLHESLNCSYLGEIALKSNTIIIEDLTIRLKESSQINLMSSIFQNKLRAMLYYPKRYRNEAWAQDLANRIQQQLSSNLT